MTKTISNLKNTNCLTNVEKRGALNLPTMLKDRRCGTLRARAQTEERKQREYITKEEVASPTIQTTSLMLSFLIHTEEKGDVAIVDVIGAYLMADMKDKIIVKLTEDAVDIRCKVNKNIFLLYL